MILPHFIVDSEMGQPACQYLLGGAFETGTCAARTVRPMRYTRVMKLIQGPFACSKMESFIRSKYESKRWAMDGSPPQDPSVLEQGSSAANDPESAPVPQETGPSRPSHATTGSISSSKLAPPAVARQPHAHQLLSANFDQTTQSAPPSAPAQEAKPAAPSNNELFSLDFHAPAAPAQTSDTLGSAQPKKDVKQDILSLFSTQNPAASASTVTPIYNAFSSAAASPWGSNAAANHQAQPTSMIGTTGVGAWGASSGWTGGSAAPSSQSGLLGTVPQSSLFNTSEVWGVPQSQHSQDVLHQRKTSASVAPTVKKDDVFGDIWGGFK